MSITSYLKKIRALAGDKKGAALPEFALAIFPLLWLFFVFVEVSTMFTAHLVLHHAAVAAARCGIVQKGTNLPGDYVKNPDGTTDKGDAETVCTQAAIDATGMGFWHQTLFSIQASYKFTPSAADGDNGQYSDLETTVQADYQCGGPLLSKRIICPSGTRHLSIILNLPHEGARYTLDPDRNPS